MVAMASISWLIPSNPVKLNHHHNLLVPARHLPPAAAFKSRIEFSRIIRSASSAVKCFEKKHHPSCSNSSFSVDDLEVVSKNRFLDAVCCVKSFDLLTSFAATFLFTLFDTLDPMLVAASLVPKVLLILKLKAVFASVLLILAGFLPSVIDENTASVINLQVKLLGMGSKRIQNKLNQIAQVADPSTRKGLNYVSTELSISLLRQIDYCIAGYSSVDVKMSSAEWKKRFKLLSIKEQGKPNVKNIWKPSSSDQINDGFIDEDIVVTILVAAQGLHKLPSISTNKGMKETLEMIASILAGNTLAVGIFWTPQNENNDMLWEQPKPDPLPKITDDNNNNINVLFSESHVISKKPLTLLLLMGCCSLIMFMCNPPSASALSPSSVYIASRVAIPLMINFTAVIASLVALFKFEAFKPQLYLSCVFICFLPWAACIIKLIGKTDEFIASVIKLQVKVAGLGSERIQMELKQTDKVVDATTLNVHSVSTKIALYLLQNIDFCISGYSSVDVMMNFDGWKKRFKVHSVKERSKFDEETLLTTNNIWTTTCYSNTEVSEDTAVVTILMAVRGFRKLPSINGTTYLKAALQKLASISTKNTMAVEVFCITRNEKETQWEEKLIMDFPLLRPL